MKKFLFTLVLMSLAACGDTNIYNDGTTKNGQQATTVASPTQPTVTSVKLEYRVSGNADSVKIKYYNPYDGLNQTVTTLPWSISFNTTADNLFVSLEVTPVIFNSLTLYPFLSAQIIVNGNIFKEVTSNSMLLNTIAVNGTWRR